MVFENLDAVAKTEHFMKFVEKKINHLRGKRDLLSLIFSAGSFMLSMENSYEINLINKCQKGNKNQISHLFHTVEFCIRS